MRCRCCDVVLSAFEATRKSKSTGEYLDMCNICYATVATDIPTNVRKDLKRSTPSFDIDFEQYDIEDTEELIYDDR